MAKLSKSDFKTASQCITKIYYKKKRYPSNTENDPFMQLLAEGGYMVGKLAQILYPGITLENIEGSADQTRKLLEQENVCIHEATIESNNKIIRIDILNKVGNVLELIEVKAKSWDSDKYGNHPTAVRKDFKEYLEDIAFQYHVLQEAYPDFTIKSFLFLPDKAKRTRLEGLNSMFSIKALPRTNSGFKGYDIQCTGNEEELRQDDIMTLVSVDDLILPMQDQIIHQASLFLETINPEVVKKQAPLAMSCRDCEYRLSQSEPLNGFAECWGDRAFADSHILDLTQLGNINKMINNQIAEGIVEKLTSYKELDPEPFIDKYSNRPYYQVKSDQEVIIPELFSEIQFKYPISFIDFEVSKMALPYHKGMRPYENVAFQWSCHKLHANGTLTHQDWINTQDSFPNFAFAESLMDHIKDSGTVLIWSSYENTILRDILNQIDEYNYQNSALKNWLIQFCKLEDEDSHGYIDLAKIANQYYHHPMAKGKYGIKWLLPAVLSELNNDKVNKWLQSVNLYKISENGSIVDPYDLLPRLSINDLSVVRDGTGVIRAYQDMMYGIHRNDPDIQGQFKDGLRQYCRLDTLAMVIIYEYWKSKGRQIGYNIT
jgi:hypothetical protein